MIRKQNKHAAQHASTNGFTLVELLVVVTLLVVIGTIIANSLGSIFRGDNKTQTTNAVAQNGDYALSVISDLVTSSINVVDSPASGTPTCLAAPQSSLVLARDDDNFTTLSCDVSGNIASTSANPVRSVFLLDTSTVKVDTTNCSFTCTQESPFSPPIIHVQFRLTGKDQNGLSENQADGVFSTSVSLRNFHQ
jgi:prepilin-type N-terminal cleavage/methylation domain-containing protein